MKIQIKLTLLFTLITAAVLLFLSLYIYLFSSSFTKNNFYTQLRERAIITATVFLEADEESSATIKSFQTKYLNTLPDELIRVYNAQNRPVFIDSSDKAAFDTSFINQVRIKKE